MAHQQFYQLVLAGVGVLILVHQQVADFLLPARQHLGVIAEQHRRHHDQVVEIDRVVGLQHALIHGISLRDQLFLRAAGHTDSLLRGNQVVFQVGNGVLHQLQHIAVVTVLAHHHVAQNAFAVVLIQNRKAVFIARRQQFMADDVQTQIVKGGNR